MGNKEFRRQVIRPVEGRDFFGSISRLRPKDKYIFNYFDISNWDMFKIGEFDNNIYVSNILRKLLLSMNVNGCYFIKSNLF